jgi:hypothetical protein
MDVSIVWVVGKNKVEYFWNGPDNTNEKETLFAVLNKHKDMFFRKAKKTPLYSSQTFCRFRKSQK